MGRRDEGENATSPIVGMVQSLPLPPQMAPAMAWLSSPRTRPPEDVIEGPRGISSCWPSPQESGESMARANGMLLQGEVQVRGIGQGAVTLPENWKAPTPMMTRGLHADPVTDQIVG